EEAPCRVWPRASKGSGESRSRPGERGARCYVGDTDRIYRAITFECCFGESGSATEPCGPEVGHERSACGTAPRSDGRGTSRKADTRVSCATGARPRRASDWPEELAADALVRTSRWDSGRRTACPNPRAA